MSRVRRHVDEVELLRYAKAALPPSRASPVESHLADCAVCANALEELRKLDDDFRALAATGDLARDLEIADLPSNDRFRRRVARRKPRRPARMDGSGLVEASGAGWAAREQLLAALRGPRAPLEVLKSLDRASTADRFGLLYALQQAGLEIAQDPVGVLNLARAVLKVSSPGSAGADGGLPWARIEAQAHMLAGQAHLWSREYAASESHLRAAFRIFTDSGEESGLAMVELAEAQRRFFVGRAAQALILAHRAWLYFERCGFASVAARAAVAKGMAFADLARFDEAAAAYRSSLPVFEREGLWSNYVGAVNSLATALFRAGRSDEARKEFARALKRLSRPAHLSWVGYLHYGLGDLLLAAARPSDAAQAFGRATARFEESKLLSSALLSRIAEAECRVRGGQRLQSSFLADVARQVSALGRPLDSAIRRRVARLSATTKPRASDLASLRDHLSRSLA